jgi:cyclophilin family peptidyl-prolyl cis-trans isomerase
MCRWFILSIFYIVIIHMAKCNISNQTIVTILAAIMFVPFILTLMYFKVIVPCEQITLIQYIIIIGVLCVLYSFYQAYYEKEIKKSKHLPFMKQKTKKFLDHVLKQPEIEQPILKKSEIDQPILKKPKIEKPRKKKLVYFDIEINGKDVGRIVMELFEDVVPKTCKNFEVLCEKEIYRKSRFHRIIKDFMIQGGNYNGSGGESIYGSEFDDENFYYKHDRPYLLSMANHGPNTNGSQFFITTSETPHLDNKHVVFGEVFKGHDVVDILNNTDTGRGETPSDNIVIAECGVL